jgi:hypothetical protein
LVEKKVVSGPEAKRSGLFLLFFSTEALTWHRRAVHDHVEFLDQVVFALVAQEPSGKARR